MDAAPGEVDRQVPAANESEVKSSGPAQAGQGAAS
jgi:hypothetical protein